MEEKLRGKMTFQEVRAAREKSWHIKSKLRIWGCQGNLICDYSIGSVGEIAEVGKAEKDQLGKDCCAILGIWTLLTIDK